MGTRLLVDSEPALWASQNDVGWEGVICSFASVPGCPKNYERFVALLPVLFDAAFFVFAASFSSRDGHARLGHISQGPRRVVMTTLGAPHASQLWPHGFISPCCGSG